MEFAERSLDSVNGPSAVRRAIERHYTKLTTQQRRIADYLLAHEHTVFAMSVSELAVAAQASEATVVRFAREVGFSGYHELRAALMEEVRQHLTPEDRFATAEPSRAAAGTVVRVADSEIDNIRHTVTDLDPAELERFVAKLRRADLVATVGLGVSSILARLAQYMLFQIGVRSQFLRRDAITLIEQVELLPRNTTLWVFSLPPYSKQTVAAAARAKERRIPVVAITDRADAPVCEYAYAALPCHSKNLLFTNSISGPLVALNAVVTDLALADKARALKQLRLTEEAAGDEYLT